MKRILPIICLFATLVSPVSRAQTPDAQPTPKSAPQIRLNRTLETRYVVDRGNVHIEVLGQGAGPVIVILPSLGRGAEDYNVVSLLLAKRGFLVLRPQPRGVGASTGPMTGLTLHDLAADIAAMIEHEGKGPVVVVGHAYGHFVARTLATDRPDLVRGVVLAAASAGKVPPGVNEPSVSPEVREAIDKSGDVSLPEATACAICSLDSSPPDTTRTSGSPAGTPKPRRWKTWLRAARPSMTGSPAAQRAFSTCKPKTTPSPRANSPAC